MTDDAVIELSRLYRAAEQNIKREQRGELFDDQDPDRRTFAVDLRLRWRFDHAT